MSIIRIILNWTCLILTQNQTNIGMKIYRTKNIRYIPGILYGWFQLHKGFGNRALSNITCSLQFVPSVSQQRISLTDTRNKSSADKSSILYLNNAKINYLTFQSFDYDLHLKRALYTKFDIYVVSYIVYLFSPIDFVNICGIVDHLFKIGWMIS